MKSLLVVGATGYLASEFIQSVDQRYNIIKLQRRGESDVNLNLSDAEAMDSFDWPVNLPNLDGIIFFQGLNPALSVKEADPLRIIDMLKVNLMAPILLMKKLHPHCNQNASVVFLSSIAAFKGSYDPSYAAAKAGIGGLIQSFSNEFQQIRFNAISLGLVEGSPVEQNMTKEFRDKHSRRMFGQKLVKAENLTKMIEMLIQNQSINRAILALDGGYHS